MGCCGKGSDNYEENEHCIEAAEELEQFCKREQVNYKDGETPYTWYPTVSNMQQIGYVRRLEKQYQSLQACYLNLSSQMARLQFRIRQIVQADPNDRERLLKDLESLVFQENYPTSQNHPEELPSLEQNERDMGDIRKKQHLLIRTLREQIGSFLEASKSLATEYNHDEMEMSPGGSSRHT